MHSIPAPRPGVHAKRTAPGNRLPVRQSSVSSVRSVVALSCEHRYVAQNDSGGDSMVYARLDPLTTSRTRLVSEQEALTQWIVRRDPDAFRCLMDLHAPMVYGTCRRILRDGAEAEDVTQECFEVLARTDKMPFLKSAGAWLHGVATHRALKRLRSEQRRKTRESGYADLAETHVRQGWADVYQHLDEAIAGLPEALRGPLVAHYLGGQSHAEIARETRMARRTVSFRIAKGIQHLAERMRERGVILPSAALAAIIGAARADASVLPAGLDASLAKLALACKVAHAANASWGVGALGGVLVMKKTVVASLVILVVLLAGWLALPVLHHAPPVVAPERAQSHPEVAGDTFDLLLEATSRKRPPSPGIPQHATAAPDNPVALGGVRGRVYNAVNGDGVKGVEIRAARSDAAGAAAPKATTDASGVFALSLASGTYELVCSGVEGFRREAAGNDAQPGVTVTVQGNAQIEGVDFALKPEALLGGQVVDGKGQPIAQASVRLKARLQKGGIDQSVETNGNGRFDFRGLPPLDAAELNAAKGSLKSPLVTVALPERGVDNVTIVLEESAGVSGSVVDPKGRPLPGIIVCAMPGPAGASISDQNGKFSLTGLPAGDYALLLRKDDASRNINFDQSEKGEPVPLHVGEHADNLVLVYDRVYAIAGRVTDTSGRPIVKAQVNSGACGVYTDAQGRYRMDDLAEGRWNLWVVCPGYRQEEHYWVKTGSNSEDFVLRALNTINGQVVNASTGSPLPHFEVVTTYGNWHPSLAGLFRSVYHAEGRFQAEVPEDGTLTVAARAKGFETVLETVNVTRQTLASSITLRLSPTAGISGIVTDRTGSPVAGAAVSSAPAASTGTGSDVVTDANGQFTLTSILPGATHIRVAHPGFAPAFVPIPAAGNNAAPVRVVLVAGGSVEGLLPTEALSLGDRRVYVEYPSETGGGRYTAKLADDGTFQVDGLPPGEATVVLAIRNGGQARGLVRTVQVSEGATSSVSFEWPDTSGAVEGTLIGGERRAKAAVAFLWLDTSTGSEWHATKSGPDGKYRFDAVPAGRCTLDADVQTETGMATTPPMEAQVLANKTVVCDLIIP